MCMQLQEARHENKLHVTTHRKTGEPCRAGMARTCILVLIKSNGWNAMVVTEPLMAPAAKEAAVSLLLDAAIVRFETMLGGKYCLDKGSIYRR